MRITLTSLSALFAFVTAVEAAEVTAKLNDVHLCCQACVDGVHKAIAPVKDVKAVVDDDNGTVTLSGADTASLQKAADALVASGYFGKSSDANVKIVSDTGAKGEKVQTLKVEGVHLCCGKCVTAVNKAIQSVPGATGHTAKRNAQSFEVTGDFNDKDVFDALQKQGLTGKVGK
jgi:periplasmic mercuric ion binding protein